MQGIPATPHPTSLCHPPRGSLTSRAGFSFRGSLRLRDGRWGRQDLGGKGWLNCDSLWGRKKRPWGRVVTPS